jgi:hypothetical protein
MRSPKGLIDFPPARGVKLEPVGPNKFKIVEAEVTDRAMVRVRATREMINHRITYLRDWARQMISGDGKDPAQYDKIIREAQTAKRATADRAYCAARLLERLDDVEWALAEVERGPDVDRPVTEVERGWIQSARESARDAIFYALALASEVHALTLVDSEGGAKQVQSLLVKNASVNAARHQERSREHARWNSAAGEIWKKQPLLSRQAVAGQVKTKLGLEEEPRTIAKRLKKPGTAC